MRVSSIRPIAAGTFFHRKSARTISAATATQPVELSPQPVGSTTCSAPPGAVV